MKKFLNRTVSMGNIYVYLLAGCALAAGCTQVDTVTAFGEGEVIEISQGTTANFGELRMGLGNASKSDYTNDAGQKKHGLVAVLWLFISGDPPQEKRFDVHAGQNLKMDKYSVYVQEIRAGSKGSITLRVKGGDPVPGP
ncbi:MAG: hypothetical protein ABIG11_01540 [bacterium]